MKKIKLFLLTLFAFIGLSASSQVLTSFNLYVINQNFCQYTLVGNYYGGGIQGSIVFSPQPAGDYYVCTLPAIDSLNVTICAISAPPSRPPTVESLSSISNGTVPRAVVPATF